MTVNDRLIKRRYSRCKIRVVGALAALVFEIGVASADTRSKATTLQPRLDFSSAVPKVLSKNDVDRYQEIFRIQEGGHWQKANALIARLEDQLLLGHILAQRFLHPTQYRSNYKELRDWMVIYADHPDARRIYKLAIRRKPKNWRNPKPPKRIKVSTAVHSPRIKKIKSRSLSRPDRSKLNNFKSLTYKPTKKHLNI